MEYTILGKTGLRVSRIGLGTEYLINTPKANVVSVVGAAFDAGINYIDLFFGQPRLREHIGAGLSGRRKKVIVAGHLGAAEKKGQYWRTRDLKISETYFHDLLKKLRTDYIDVLFLHNCDKEGDYRTVFGDFFDLARKFKTQGKARYIAFSNHVVPIARKAIRREHIDVLLYPVNMTDASAGTQRLLRACAARNIGLVAMKPFGGGKLLKKETAGCAITPVQCLAYTLAQPGVHCVLPGPRNREELEGCLHVVHASQKEKDYASVLRKIKPKMRGECVYCNHCLPCPAAIDIGETIRAIETGANAAANAARCTGCGVCSDRCPFGVDVAAKMNAAQR